jgi:hypothetical protein
MRFTNLGLWGALRCRELFSFDIVQLYAEQSAQWAQCNNISLYDSYDLHLDNLIPKRPVECPGLKAIKSG